MSTAWTFLTNYAHVLICLSENPEQTLREVSNTVGITERTTHRIVKDMEREGSIKIEQHGRRNIYRINLDFPLRHPLEDHCTVGDLLSMNSRAGTKRNIP